ncbi:MAG: glycoside hydrolase family 73 protein [Terriglobia bacterium]
MRDQQRHFLRKLAPAVQAMTARTGLPAAVVLAQAILESDWGRSELARRHRNLFGIKAEGRPQASLAAEFITTEYRGGKRFRTRTRFARYRSYEECVRDYARVLAQPRFAPARAVAGNPAAFARELQRCGYATDPRYAHKLGILVRRYELTQYELATGAEASPDAPQGPARLPVRQAGRQARPKPSCLPAAGAAGPDPIDSRAFVAPEAT